MSSMSFWLDDQDIALIKWFARQKNVSVSELIRSTVIDKIEEELDIELFDKAYKEMKRAYSFDETKGKLGL